MSNQYSNKDKRGKFIRVDLTGRKFGRLLVIKMTTTKKSENYPYGIGVWECQCDCGKIVNRQTRSLIREGTVSCGCAKYEKLRKAPGEAARNLLYCQYRAGARHRGISFALEKERFNQLIEQNCNYCNSPPSQVTKPPINNRKEWREQGKIVYNGIDRVDSNKGYSTENCVSCCKLCNAMKWDNDVSQFLEQVVKIYKHRILNSDEKT